MATSRWVLNTLCAFRSSGRRRGAFHVLYTECMLVASRRMIRILDYDVDEGGIPLNYRQRCITISYRTMKTTFSTIIGFVVVLAMVATAGCDRERTDVIEGAEDTTTAGDTVNVLTETEQGENWELLFAGEDLDDWKGYQSDSISSKWVVDDNAIHFDPDVEGAGGDLVTGETYEDFELSFEWKISECGNSGVIYRGSEADQYDQPWNTGPEYQILDNACHPDASNGPDRMAAAAYDMYAPSEDVTRPAGEWNQSRIVADSSHVEHWLNGTKVLEYDLGSEEWNQRLSESKWTDYPDFGTVRDGVVALQDHGDPVWYRNIKIRRL